MSMNNGFWMGNLVRDVELRNIGENHTVANFTICVSKKIPDKTTGEPKYDKAYLDCEAWDARAKTLAQYFKKGSRIIVRASIKQENWEKDGQKRSRLKFRVEEFWFVDSNKSSPPKNTNSEEENDGDKNGDDNDDIPF